MKRVFVIWLMLLLLLCLGCNLEANNKDVYTFLQDNAWYDSQNIDSAEESDMTTSDTLKTTYVSGYNAAETLIDALNAALTNAVAVYNNTNYDTSVNVTYNCFASRRRPLTATVGSGLQETWLEAFSNHGYKNVVCENAARDNYVFTFDTTSTAFVTEANPTGACTGRVVCDYNVTTGAMRYVYYENDDVIEYFILSPQTGDMWALTDMYSRAVIRYEDGKVLAAVYGERKNDVTEDNPDARPYALAENDIFGKPGYSIAWVTGDKDNMQRLTLLEEGTFTLDRCQRFARAGDPPTYEWVWSETCTAFIGDQWIELTPEPTADPSASPSPEISPEASDGASPGTSPEG